MKISTVNYNSEVNESFKRIPKEEGESLLVKVIQNASPIKSLFDFTSKKNKTMKFKAFESVVLGVDKKKPVCVGVNPETRELEKKKDRQYMLSISKLIKTEDFPFQIEVPGNFIDLQYYPRRPIWLVVGSLRSSFGNKQLGWELSVGDRLKMGREEYRISEMRQWVDEEKDKIMLHETFLQNRLGRI